MSSPPRIEEFANERKRKDMDSPSMEASTPVKKPRSNSYPPIHKPPPPKLSPAASSKGTLQKTPMPPRPPAPSAMKPPPPSAQKTRPPPPSSDSNAQSSLSQNVAKPKAPLGYEAEDPNIIPKVDLPDGWMSVYSNSKQKWYYFDKKTNKSVWEWPPPSL
jgi:hypothetical protein